MKNTIYYLLVIILFVQCDSSPRKTHRTNDSNEEILTASHLDLPQYNIYIENSGSMDGYVNGPTDFKNTIYNYLSDILLSDISDTITLNYINTKIIPYENSISDFIEKLNPTTFKKRGGDRSSTDIANLLDLVLEESNSTKVNILISDFIFSPPRNSNPDEYLANQETKIRVSMATFLRKNPNQGIIIYQLDSRFNGVYYNKANQQQRYDGKRPYYMWIIGDKQNLSTLVNKCPTSKIKGGVENIFTMTREDSTPKYAVKHGSGNFKLDKKNPKTHIVDAKKDTKGSGDKQKMRFSVNVDFSNILIDESYIMNAANYNIDKKDYGLAIEKSQSKDYTHVLKLSSDIVQPNIVTINLRSQLPEWVKQINDSIGMDVYQASGKTYGIRSLIDGIYGAFKNNGDNYTTIKIYVNQ